MSPDVPEVDAPTKVAVAEQRELLRDGAAVLTWVRRFAPVLRRGVHGHSLRPLRRRRGEEQNDEEGGDRRHASSGQSHDPSPSRVLLPAGYLEAGMLAFACRSHAGERLGQRLQHVVRPRGSQLFGRVLAGGHPDTHGACVMNGPDVEGVSPTTSARRGSRGWPWMWPARWMALRVSSPRSRESEPYPPKLKKRLRSPRPSLIWALASSAPEVIPHRTPSPTSRARSSGTPGSTRYPADVATSSGSLRRYAPSSCASSRSVGARPITPSNVIRATSGSVIPPEVNLVMSASTPTGGR